MALLMFSHNLVPITVIFIRYSDINLNFQYHMKLSISYFPLLCYLCVNFPSSLFLFPSKSWYSFNLFNLQHDLDPLSGVISVGSSVKVLVDYRPVRDDDIAVFRGDVVLVVDIDSGRGYRVKKQGAPPHVEGWVPGYVLNLLTGGPRRPAWTFRKFRKPSFNNRKDSSGKLVRTVW